MKFYFTKTHIQLKFFVENYSDLYQFSNISSCLLVELSFTTYIKEAMRLTKWVKFYHTGMFTSNEVTPEVIPSHGV